MMMGDTTVYLWGAYAMGALLVLVEVGLLALRGSAIRRYLGCGGTRAPMHSLR